MIKNFNKKLPELTRPPVEQDKIANWIRQQILTERISPGERLPPRSNLISQFNVSSLTVQRAMNQLIEDSFIETHGPRGSFVVNKPPHQYRIGLAFHPKIQSLSWSNLWDALLKAANQIEKEGTYRFVIYTGIDTHMDTEDARRLERDIARHSLAGIMFDTFSIQAVIQNKINCASIPVINIGDKSTSSHIPKINPKLKTFYNCSLKYLKQIGCKNIAVLALANTDMWNNIPLIESCFKSNNLTWHAEWMQGAPLPTAEWSTQILRLLFSSNAKKQPDGLIIADDNLAPAAAGILEELSIRIPEDLHVVSLCNYPATENIPQNFEWVGYNIYEALKKTITIFNDLRQNIPVKLATPIPAQHYSK